MSASNRQLIDSNPKQLQKLDNPFAQEAHIKVREEEIQQISPQMGSTLRQRLANATEKHSFGTLRGELNERAILDKQYQQIAQRVNAELGPFTFNIFNRMQPLVYSAALQLVKESRDSPGNFQSKADASTGSDFVIEPLLPQSFGGSASDYVFPSGTAGEFDIAPGFGGAATNDTYTTKSGEQAMVIFGAELSTNPRVLQSVGIGLDDGQGGRLPEIIGKAMSGSTQQAVETVNGYYVPDNQDVKITGIATESATVEFPLLGVNIVNAPNAVSHSSLENSF